MPDKIITLPSWLGDHMVLQQQVRTRIYGKTKPKAPVRLSLERFPSGEAIPGRDTEYGLTFQENDIAEDDGFFEFKLPMADGSFDSYRLTIESAGERVVFKDISYGEVWMALGGSNMSMPLFLSDLASEIPRIASQDRVRFYTQNENGLPPGSELYSPKPLAKAYGGHWLEPHHSREFSQLSALASGFALKLSQVLRLPIGIFNLACPNSCLHSWLPSAVVEQDAILKNHVREIRHYRDREHWNALPPQEKKEERTIKKSPEAVDISAQDPPFSRVNQPGALFNHKLAPYAGLPVRGVLWYQGEEDCQHPDYYRRAFLSFVNVLKELFQTPTTGLKLIYSQLAPFMASDHDFMRLAYFNEALAVLRHDLPLSAAIVTNYDLPPDFPMEDPLYRSPKTPRAKELLAERMKDLALGLVYLYDLPSSAPEIVSAERVGNKLLLRFDQVGKGVRLRNGSAELKGFSICGEDGNYLQAQARDLYNVRVIVWNDEISEPLSCSYAFYNFNREANLCSASGMPLLPFRLSRDFQTVDKPKDWAYCDALSAYRWPSRTPDAPRIAGRNVPGRFPLWKLIEGRGKLELEYENKRSGSSALKLSYSKADEHPVKFAPVLDYASDYPPLDLHQFSEMTMIVFNTDHRQKTIQLYLADSNGGEILLDRYHIRDELNWQIINFPLANLPVDLQRLIRMEFAIQDPEAAGILYIDKILFSLNPSY